MDYGVRELLGGSEAWAAHFVDGSFATVYLSPRDYHRVHMPLDGTLLETCYVPGRLYSVNRSSTRLVRGLFARNERLIAWFDTAAGPVALALIGAIFVSGIETVWDGPMAHHPGGDVVQRSYRDLSTPIRIRRGAELGRFNMGSTVIVLFARGRVDLNPALRADSHVEMGQLLGNIVRGEG
jgi:phosphatidylserine decarboxylase